MTPLLAALAAGCGALAVEPVLPDTDAGGRADVGADARTDARTDAGPRADVVDGGPIGSDSGVAPRDGSNGGCPGSQLLCSGACIDVSISPFHCGSCDNRCAAGDLCVAGSCHTPCRAPNLQCGDQCVDVQSDVANCGGCGHTCDADARCMNGVCHGLHDPTYNVETVAPATWLEACEVPGGRAVVMTPDDDAVLVPLPFSVRYWGTTLAAGANVNVCTNGWLGLDGMRNTSFSPRLPTMGSPEPYGVVAPYWRDLYLRSNVLCVATFGAAPDRSFVAEWQDVSQCCTTTSDIHLTFEAVLHETTGVIDFVYNDIRGGDPGGVGIENLAGDTSVSPCATSTMCPVHTGEQLRFTPVN